MTVPSPPDLGLPPKYKEWRPEQILGIEFARSSKRRVRGLAAPTGTGKTGVVWALAQLALRDDPHARILILTETKGLQKVYADEGKRLRKTSVANISGANNYICHALEPGGRYDYMSTRRGLMCDNAPCSAGLPCKLRDQGCEYYGDGALAQAREASVVITNYANWLSAADMAEREEKFGEFDLVIMDEGHAAVDAVCKALSVELDLRDVEHLTDTAGVGVQWSFEQWIKWAAKMLSVVDSELDDLQAEIKNAKSTSSRVPPPLLDDLRRMQRVQRTLVRVSTARGEWVTARSGPTKVEFKLVWPSDYCESHLLRGIKEAVIMSATLVSQDLRYLGLRDDQFDFLELDSTFPPERRPIYLLPCARMRWNMDAAEEQKMLDGLDAVLKTRPDWRFLVHAISYARMKFIEARSRQRGRMRDHAPSTKDDTIDWFRKSAPLDAVLISPALHTGYDFPDDECRGQIIVKIPFPDTRDPVVKARIAKDKKYLYYAAMRYIVQAAGRIVRSMTDFGETWVTDSNALWFFDPNGPAAEYMPRSIRPAIKRVNGIGRAPKL